MANSITYQAIKAGDFRNVYVVGDLHGHLTWLEGQLEKVEFDRTQDLLICTGDLIDRGEDCLGCLRLMDESWFATIKGNHEYMAQDALMNSDGNNWLYNGGGWYFKLPAEDKAEANALLLRTVHLPNVIELEYPDGKRVVVSHARFPSPYGYGTRVALNPLIWDRFHLQHRQKGFKDPTIGADLFIYGHNTLDAPVRYSNEYYIDTSPRPTVLKVTDLLAEL